jgi:hypothetical protein
MLKLVAQQALAYRHRRRTDRSATAGPRGAPHCRRLAARSASGQWSGYKTSSSFTPIQNPQAPAEMLQLIGNLICFRLNPGPDAKRICEERLTTASVRTWVQNDQTKIKQPSSEDIILNQDDLARLRITREGAEGYLIIGNAAFGLLWPFPKDPCSARRIGSGSMDKGRRGLTHTAAPQMQRRSQQPLKIW